MTTSTSDTSATTDTDDSTDIDDVSRATPAEAERPGGRSVSLRSLALGTVATAVAVVIAVLSWRLVAVSDERDAASSAAADRTRAETVALQYATGAAQMDYQNPDDWRTRLTANTSPELADRLRSASQSMQQLIVPLQWTSTSNPIAAKVVGNDNGSFQVDAFVDVTTKNAQAPDGIQSTATYKITVDPRQNWLITDISGIGTNLTPSSGGQTPARPAPSAPAPGN